MATVYIKTENRKLTDPAEIAAFLKPHGIQYERWSLDDRCSPDADQAEILKAYAPEVERVMQAGGYVTADVISVNPATPNLDAMLNKFNKEHTHSDDEVRFIVKGSGVFHIHPKGGTVFGIEMEAGDLINVPAGTMHWFDLCPTRLIRAIRLFKDQSGWTPLYTGDAVAEGYPPVCFGPAYVTAG